MPFPEILKSRVRKRAHFQCCLCKALGVEVHHVIPEVDGGPDTEANAAPLCPSCHETYGMNPTKRKFIREARDLWFDICYRRYAPDADRLEEIKQIARGAVSRDDFERFKEELMTRLDIQQLLTPRTEDEILVAIDEFFDKIWYDRHQMTRQGVESGDRPIAPDIWQGALEAAGRVEAKYSKAELGPYTDFEWGMLNGKLSALRWVLGDDWDMLDT